MAERPSLSMRMVIYGIAKKFPAVKHITCEQLELWIADADKNLVLLDTRAADEYAVSHIPNAVHVDPEQDHSFSALNIQPNSTVVCYCSVGYRSSDVACKLYRSADRRGSVSLFNLEGGLFQWGSEGRELVDATGSSTTIVHPYNSLWGHLLPSKLRACI